MLQCYCNIAEMGSPCQGIPEVRIIRIKQKNGGTRGLVPPYSASASGSSSLVSAEKGLCQLRRGVAKCVEISLVDENSFGERKAFGVVFVVFRMFGI